MWRTVDRNDLPPDDGRYRIDGLALSQYPVWLTSDGVEIGEATPTFGMTDIPGRPPADLTLEDPAGASATSRRNITMHLLTAGTWEDCMETMSKLGALNGRRGRFDDLAIPGTFEGRWSMGAATMKPRHGAIIVDLTLDASPWMLGPKRHADLNQGGNGVNPHGNACTPPTFTVTAMKGDSASISDGTRSITIPGPFDGDERITIDCENSIVEINGNPSAPTLDSDWPTLVPWHNTITLTGCHGRMEWRPRTL